VNLLNYLGFVVSDLFFSKGTIFCGTGPVLINAYFLGKDVLEIEKCAVFGWWGDLMNRLIHRSWGKGVVNIFLDLSKFIYRCSSQLASVLREERRFPASTQVLLVRLR
jgi:hypothetical protein